MRFRLAVLHALALVGVWAAPSEYRVAIVIGFLWSLLVIFRPRGPMPDDEVHRSVHGYGGAYNEWEQR